MLGLGLTVVSSESRVPIPPAKITHFKAHPLFSLFRVNDPMIIARECKCSSYFASYPNIFAFKCKDMKGLLQIRNKITEMKIILNVVKYDRRLPREFIL